MVVVSWVSHYNDGGIMSSGGELTCSMGMLGNSKIASIEEHMSVYVFMHASANTHMHIYISAHVHPCMRVCTHVCMHAWIHVDVLKYDENADINRICGK